MSVVFRLQLLVKITSIFLPKKLLFKVINFRKQEEQNKGERNKINAKKKKSMKMTISI